MPATRQVHESRKIDAEDVLKRPVPGSEDSALDDAVGVGTPALPDLEVGPLEPEAWLALQQTIGNSAVGALVEQRRSGQPLPPKTRHDMEAYFGRDFGQVKVHTGPEVDQAAQALDAAAFTVSDDVFVRSDLPGVEHPLGRAVLGEELAHVAQGVGREGIRRITDPSEAAEQEAHTAGLAAAAGEHAHVSSSYKARNAVARWDLSGVIGAAAEAMQAALAEPTEIKDEEKDRLAAGALAPLTALWTQLGDKMLSGKPSTKAITAIASSAEGISSFIFSFSGPAAVQPTIEAAATSAVRGRQALLAAIDPVAAAKASAGILTAVAGEIEGLATPPQPAATTPPSDASATPGAAPAPDALTAAEAAQLKLGGAQPLKNAAAQLQGDEPDLDVILAIIKGVPAVLRSFTKPAALVPQLHAKAMDVEGQIARLEAVRGGPEAAIHMAMSEWQKSIGLLQSLTAKSAGGATPDKAAAPGDAGGDEDKKKPN